MPVYEFALSRCGMFSNPPRWAEFSSTKPSMSDESEVIRPVLVIAPELIVPAVMLRLESTKVVIPIFRPPVAIRTLVFGSRMMSA